MGAVRFSIDPRLVRKLKRKLPLRVFVETGTYEGASVRAAEPLFEELHTIELSQTLYERAAAAFESEAKVHVHQGRSQEVLQTLAPELAGESILYWLDAHWSDEEHAEGADEQCPLLAELEAIGALDETSVVMIDDARLFLAPPTAPAPTEGWPQLTEVIDRLNAISRTHDLIVIDDVILYFPPQVAKLVRHFAHHNGVDWANERDGSRGMVDELTRVRGEIEDLRRETTNRHRSRSKQVRRQMRALEKEIKSLGERAADGSDLPDLRAEMASLSEQVATLHGGMDELAPKLDVVENRQSKSSSMTVDRLEALGTQIDSLRTDLDRLVPKLEAAESRQSQSSEATVERLEAVSAQLETLETRVDEAQASRFPFAALRGRRSGPGPLRRLGQRLWGSKLGSVALHAPRELRVPGRYRRREQVAEPPLISVVTVSERPRGRPLERTIESVLDQEYDRLEYIVEDAAPSKRTGRVLARYEDRLAHAGSHPDEEPAAALNLGFDRSTGELMGYLAAGDVLLPGALGYVAHYLERHPDVDVVYGHRLLVDRAGKEIGRWVLPRHDDHVLRWAHYVSGEAAFWRRSIWEESGAEVGEDLGDAMDWELLLRFHEVGAGMARVPRFLSAERVGNPDRLTSHRAELNGHEELRRLRARVHGREVSDEEARRAVRGYLRRHVVLQKMYRLHLLRY